MSETKNDLIGCQSYGIFWDIENCPIPTSERAANVVQSIKQFIATKFESSVGHHSESCTFICSCDTRNLDQKHVEGLNRCGVDILHVNPVRTSFKVDADSKLMECIQKFVEHHFHKGLVFVITGDIDFAPAIRSAKRKGFEVILLFGANTSQDLKNCATEAHSYYEIINRDIETNATPLGFAGLSFNNAPIASSSRTSSISSATLLNSNREPLNVAPVKNPSAQTAIPLGYESLQTGNRSESRDRSRSQHSNIENTTEFDGQKLRTVMEVTGIERHIALRMLQICNGNVELAINAVFSD